MAVTTEYLEKMKEHYTRIVYRMSYEEYMRIQNEG